MCEGGGGLATMREMRVREREVSWDQVCERERRTDKRKERHKKTKDYSMVCG